MNKDDRHKLYVDRIQNKKPKIEEAERRRKDNGIDLIYDDSGSDRNMTVVVVRRDEQIRDVAVLPGGRPVMLKGIAILGCGGGPKSGEPRNRVSPGIDVLDDVAAAGEHLGDTPVADICNVLAGVAADGEHLGDSHVPATPEDTEEHDASSFILRRRAS